MQSIQKRFSLLAWERPAFPSKASCVLVHQDESLASRPTARSFAGGAAAASVCFPCLLPTQIFPPWEECLNRYFKQPEITRRGALSWIWLMWLPKAWSWRAGLQSVLAHCRLSSSLLIASPPGLLPSVLPFALISITVFSVPPVPSSIPNLPRVPCPRAPSCCILLGSFVVVPALRGTKNSWAQSSVGTAIPAKGPWTDYTEV